MGSKGIKGLFPDGIHNGNYNYIFNNDAFSIISSLEYITNLEFPNFDKKKNLNDCKARVALIGRFNTNHKLLSSFFPKENLEEKFDNFIINKDNESMDVHPFFANLNNFDNITCSFSSFYKLPSFNRAIEFKTDLFSESYENCLDINLNEISLFYEYLAKYDIVIYSTESNNENIIKEAKYFDYLCKKSPLLKSKINDKKFYIILNRHSSNCCLYYYQNEEAKSIFENLNKNFEYKFIYEMDLEKCYEEKIIYLSSLIKNEKLETINEEMKNCKNEFLNKNLSTNFDYVLGKFHEIIKQKYKILNSKNFIGANGDIYKSIHYEKFYSKFLKLDFAKYSSYYLNIIKEFDKEIYDSILDSVCLKINNLKQEIILSNYFLGNGEYDDIINSFKIKYSLNKEIIKNNRELIIKKIDDNFNFLQKQIDQEVIYFMKKFADFYEKIQDADNLTLQKRNLKGEKIIKYKLQFLFEVFDLYGLKHYFTSLSIEAVNTYINNMKKMFLNFTKLINIINITLNSLDTDINNSYVNFFKEINLDQEILLKQDFNITKFIKAKSNGLNFFNTLLFKVFSTENISYKPIFAFYNITNLIGLLSCLFFFVKSFKKYFKFQPNIKKIVLNVLYGLLAMLASCMVSCILNKFYNKKSEKKFIKLISTIKGNIIKILNMLENYKNLINDYKKEYKEKSTYLLN